MTGDILRSWQALPDLFARQVSASPSAVAVTGPDGDLTYAELNDRANRLALLLSSHGAGPGATVAFSLGRNLDYVVTVLAIVKAGAAYVPLDPVYPDERIAMMVSDAAPKVVVVQQETAPRVRVSTSAGSPSVVVVDAPDTLVALADGSDSEPVPPAADIRPAAERPAYVLFTSGSSGRPKGVMVTHANIAALALDQIFTTPAHRVVLAHAPQCFDAATYELWVPLLNGGRIVLSPGVLEPDRLGQLIAGHGVTGMFLTASLFNLCVELDPSVFSTLSEVLVGGEACSSPAMRAFLEACPQTRLRNGYGPTETTTFATQHPTDREDTFLPSVPIGRALDGDVVLVLDEQLRPVPVGGVGALYVAGAGVALGYLGRPAATAERFVACPYGPPGQRMYHTGDQVRRLESGALEFLGRLDAQVKVRGHRIEPGEIESALVSRPGVAQACVVAHGDKADEKRLVGYVVAESSCDLEELRGHLRRVLPAHLVPDRIIVIDALPLTINGKADRTALAARPLPGGPVDPSGDLDDEPEHGVAALWKSLNLPLLGLHDEFLTAGVSSLDLARFTFRLRRMRDSGLSLADVFKAGSLANVASRLRSSTQSKPADQFVPVDAGRPRPEPLRLSSGQFGLWHLTQFSETTAAYHVPLLIPMRTEVDPKALGAALRAVVARHESLRTVFPTADGEPFQKVLCADVAHPAVRTWDVHPDELDLVVRRLASEPFDLTEDLPLRAEVLRTGLSQTVVLLVLHHIACDGWSIAPICRDLASAYRDAVQGRLPNLAALPAQYADHSLWQEAVFASGRDGAGPAARQRDFWAQTLAELPTELHGLTDQPREASNAAGAVSAFWEPPLHQALYETAGDHRVTLFMVLQAGLAAVLTHRSGSSDIPLGTVVAGRGDPVLEDLAGYFVNSLTLRTDTSGDPSFTQLLDRVRASTLLAFDNQDLPFQQVVEVVRPQRKFGRNPLFQTALVLQNTPWPMTDLNGDPAEVLVPPNGTSKFDLYLEFRERRDAYGARGGLECRAEFSAQLYDKATVVELLTQMERLLSTAAHDPSLKISKLPATDAKEPTHMPLPLSSLFEDQAASHAEEIALSSAEGELTYRELNSRANRLARLLIRHGAGRGRPVALALRRSPHQIVAVLAVLKAGSCYLPLDPERAAEQIPHMVEDSAPVLVLSEVGLMNRLPDALRPDVLLLDSPQTQRLLAAERASDLTDEDRQRPVTGNDPAYIMYTSGSTGRPKGVVVTQANIADFALDAVFQTPAQDRVLIHSPLGFDASTYELWVPLLNGRQMILAPAGPLDIESLAGCIRERRITALLLTASLFQLLAQEDPASLENVSQLWTGGEAVPPEAVRQVLLNCPGLTVIDAYGPTEATVAITTHSLDQAGQVPETVPVGRPLGAHQIYLLDEHLRQVAPGEVAELYVAGPGVADGYVNRPVLTAARFVACPFGPPGARMYRTGDLARVQADGAFVLIGRTDDQLKIRGRRIEPGEVEHAVRRHPQVLGTAVVAHGASPADKRLVGYYTAEADLSPAALRAWLIGELPDQLVPDLMVRLDQLPLTANGKTDRAMLTALPLEIAPSAGPAAVPQSDLTRKVAAHCAEVLGIRHIGPGDDFFGHGGTSMLATRLVARIVRSFELRPKDSRNLLKALLHDSTVDALAGAVARALTPDQATAPQRTVPDFAAESVLDAGLGFPRQREGSHRRPQHALLTGATGFLGAHLLADLLSRSDMTVHCLVRAADDAAATLRIKEALTTYGLDGPDLDTARIIAVAGDLAGDRLGLSPEHHAWLSDNIDLIYHNAAWVNFLYPYSALSPVNVEGTRQMIRLAAGGRSKALHYISTQAVFSSAGLFGVRAVDEADVPSHPDHLFMGYPETKWVSEELIRKAGGQGMRYAIHRPHDVTGHSKSGNWKTDGFLCTLIKTFVAMGAAPDCNLPMDFTPVDLVTGAIVQISLDLPADGSAHHLNNPRYAILGDLVRHLNEAGHQVDQIPWDQWIDRLLAFTGERPESGIAPFTPLFTERWGAQRKSVVELYLEDSMPILSCVRTWKLVGELTGTSCPPTEDLLSGYIGQLTANGFLTSENRGD
ncbi:non-ribosomal peptide synthetase [Streptomyces sp. NBC_00091]|uniref:non-ribosomal peptide synthetase n=1 Tax=Streptomyces sp. NBC_00091 TaxID=2975648 RepID=UPI00225720EB|nr:non-ribosomal peptide synthetase [Streptomyces sp. NBC_00091]MCX5381458.1 amino acid adenylation domain-containing protein [Streptomyces sp. NBC_00091]